jgi:predicted ATPase
VITTVAVTGYRSLRDVVVPLQGLDVVSGANGTGKSSLYRALRLLADCSAGRVVASLAGEGGLPSVLWAGPETLSGVHRGGASPDGGPDAVQGLVRKGPVSLQLGFATDDGFGYLVDLGLPVRDDASAFNLDPEIKRELVWSGPVARPAAVLVERRGPHVRLREGRGWTDLPLSLRSWESLLTEVVDPVQAPEVLTVREQIRSWRFYDSFRTDPEAPARQAQLGTRTPVLGHDGRDLAAALQTIVEIGDRAALDAAVGDAFPGSRLDVTVRAGRFELLLAQSGVLRPLRAPELSDGTLRYLLLVAAMLSPRPPALMVLNEPETSLHPELLPALARLVRAAADRSQVVVVSHSDALVDGLAGGRVELTKRTGETVVVGQGPLDAPPWHWGSR